MVSAAVPLTTPARLTRDTRLTTFSVLFERKYLSAINEDNFIPYR